MSQVWPYLYALLFGVAILWILVSLVRAWRSGRDRARRLAENGPIVFEERGVSGRSLSSLKTKLTGAGTSLDVIVTETALWVGGRFPSSFVTLRSDLEHCIPRACVHNATQQAGKVLVEFTRTDGTEGQLELELIDPRGFVRALGIPAAST